MNNMTHEHRVSDEQLESEMYPATTGATLGDILGNALGHLKESITQVPVATPTVDRMLNVYDKQWSATAEQCLQRAVELEKAADELRQRADKLFNSRTYLDDVKTTVLFEIESRDRSASLALVNPLPKPVRELCGRRGGNCSCTTVDECIHQG